jgi:flavodoxin
MKRALLVYESKYGNTKRIAEAIAEGIRQAGDIECKLVVPAEAQPDELLRYDAILFGSPNHMQEPSRGVTGFIDRAASVDLRGKLSAAFDTYMGANKGVAVGKLQRKIREKLRGLKLVAEGFSAEVKSRTGPLVDGEIPRAQQFGLNVGHAILGQ